MQKKGVVLLSGGLDSSTVLAIAQSEGFDCHVLSFDYGQRHNAELVAAKAIVEVEKLTHRVINLDVDLFKGSSLTDQTLTVPSSGVESDDIPNTYVPARNTLFLSFALAYAESIGAQDIFIGANAVDYSGYPDCRPEYLESYEKMANLATKLGVEGHKITIHAPLLYLTKEGIIKKGLSLGVDYSLTVSCYSADDQGRACGLCDSCHFRRKGFEQLGVCDPTRYQLM